MRLNFRPLAAIAVVLALLGVTVLLLGIGGSGGGRDPAGVAAPAATTRLKLVAKLMPRRLSAPISGEVVVPMAGRLAVIGGLDGSGASASGIFSLDPRSASLHSTGVLPQPLHDAAGATVGSRALLFGGGSSASTDTVESVPPRGDAHVVGRLPAPRSDLVAAGVGGRVYVLGGYDGAAPDPTVLATSDGRHFREVAKLTVPVRYPAVAVSGGSIFLLGGQMAGGGPTDAIQRIDPKTGNSRIVGRLPAALDHATALTLRGHTYLLGGSTSHGPSDAISEFDPQSGATKAAGRLPMAVAGAAGAVSGGRGYLVGGTGHGGGSLASVIRIELKTLKVKAATSPSAAREAVAAAVPGADPAKPVSGAPGTKRPFDGLLMIADRGNNRLIVVNTAKKVVWRYPARGRPAPKGGFYFPDDAFFTHHGTGIITNQEENETIVELAYPSGRVTRSYGHPGVIGSGQGYLHEPDDAYLLRDGTITVADAQNCRILSIPPHGRASQIGTTGTCVHNPPRSLGSPNGDTPLANGDLLVSEINGSWVDELTPKGKVRWSVHLPIAYPSDPQQLGPNRYLLADYSRPGGIYEFNRAGRILWSYHPASGKGMLDHPSLVERLPNGLLVTNDDYRHRVVIIDPKTKRIVWQYGSADHPGRGPNHLNIPDGIDLLAPGGRTPTHPFTG